MFLIINIAVSRMVRTLEYVSLCAE